MCMMGYSVGALLPSPSFLGTKPNNDSLASAANLSPVTTFVDEETRFIIGFTWLGLLIAGGHRIPNDNHTDPPRGCE